MHVVPSPEGSDLVNEYSLAFELQKELYERVKPKAFSDLCLDGLPALPGWMNNDTFFSAHTNQWFGYMPSGNWRHLI